MKKNFYFLTILVAIVSCEKENIEPSNPGFLDAYLKNNPEMEVTKIAEPYSTNFRFDSIVYGYSDYGVYRGYYIEPLKDIKIKAIGCKTPEKGVHKIMLFSGALYDFSRGEYIYADSVNITNINKFHYKEINQELMLSAEHRYLLVYYRKNPKYCYKAEYNDTSYSNDENLKIPYEINDIIISELFDIYGIYLNDGTFYFMEGGGLMYGNFRLKGLVDIRYELIE